MFIKAGPELSYSSLEDIYGAAFAAGVKRIDLDTGGQTISWEGHGITFTLAAGSRKGEIKSDEFRLKGPDEARLNIDVSDAQENFSPENALKEGE